MCLFSFLFVWGKYPGGGYMALELFFFLQEQIKGIIIDGGPSQDTWAAHWLAEATKARPRPTRDSATRHPCRQAAFFLPCASRPPDVCRLRLVRPRLHHGARHSRAFLTTSSGFDTMTRRRQDATDDKITEADDTAGDATFGGAPHQWPKAGHTSFYA